MTRFSSLRSLIPIAALTAGGTPSSAEVRCPPVFGTHMVLQRDQPVPVWGNAAAGEKVTVEFAGKKSTATADPHGVWQVKLAPLPASGESRTLVVRGSNVIHFEDVLVGEVWLCSGQSNMEKPLGNQVGQRPTENAQEEIRSADHPTLRLFQMPRGGQSDRIDSTRQWHACQPEILDKTRFSAAAYFFGRELIEKLGVPVGLIHTSVGGTRIEPWTVPTAYEGLPGLSAYAAPGAGDGHIDGIRIGELYDSMVKPFVPFSLRGFLWYQGESNLISGDGDIYTEKMRALINGWRAAWAEPEAPFYFVQLAPHLYTARKQPKLLSADALPLFWEAQTKALSIPHTGMAVITDTVDALDDIHPVNKRDVGLRLARLALARTYQKDVVDSGPVLKEFKILDGNVALKFENAEGLRCRDDKPPGGFTIAGEDRVFVPAVAKISQGGVIVSSPEVKEPAAVRFAWSERANPNLVNSAGLPARSFRTDIWPASVVLEEAVTTDPPR
jgi:sialate O-acetylesterase